ncbi:hypothetical protein [Parasitella parasitica]|uniref:RING-type domain-containing protein n=1 Tax=Parasitella parasitica TaxID=35722 RepID=A0A0B7NQN6_9FUNG|nr:hypothetical protein [Parasitella parasitica]
MLAVCGICIYKSFEERCCILMPGCGHVFDKACIDNSLGLEYTCPECQCVYLLPSPYRPTILSADNSEHQEYIQMRKSVAEANEQIYALKAELQQVKCELAIERRKHEKCNEALTTPKNALEIHKSGSHDRIFSKRDLSSELSSSAINNLAVANVPTTKTRTQPTEIEANTSKKTSFEQTKSQYTISQGKYNQLLNKKKKYIPETLMKWEEWNQSILNKLYNFQTLVDIATERLQATRSSSNSLQIDKKKLLKELNSSVQVSEIIQQHSKLEQATTLVLQQKISACNKKMDELEDSEQELDMTNRHLQAKLEKLVAFMPDKNTMDEFDTASSELQITAKTKSLMLKIKQSSKWRKMGEKLQSMMRDTKSLARDSRSHANNLKQAEKLIQSLVTMNRELRKLG